MFVNVIFISTLVFLLLLLSVESSSMSKNKKKYQRRLQQQHNPNNLHHRENPLKPLNSSSVRLSRSTNTIERNCNPSQSTVKWQGMNVDYNEYYNRHHYTTDYNPITDSKKCIHRHERRYGQNEILAHSTRLQQLFEEYAEFHRNHTRKVNITEDLMRVSSNYDRDVKYLYVEATSSGLGNRINIILTGFLMALYTKRILLVRSNDWDIDYLFCQPFAFADPQKDDGTSEWRWPEALVNNPSLVPKFGANYMQVRGYEYNRFEELAGGRDHNHDKTHIWHFNGGEQYMIPLFYLGKESRNFMNYWFPNRDPGKHLFQYLFHPRDHIWYQILATYNTIKDSTDTFTVGLQLRNAHMYGEWKCIDYKQWPDNTHFFIASLFDGRSVLTGSHEFCQNFNENWKFTQVFSEQNEIHDNQQTSHALHDIWILSMMDESILSPKSTFGYFSMALSGKRWLYPAPTQHMCSNYYNTHLEEKTCYRAISYEPCYHMYISYNYADQGLTPENYYNKTIVRCEDLCEFKNNMPYGWKVVTL